MLGAQGCLLWDAPDQHSAIKNATDKAVQVARSFAGAHSGHGVPGTGTAVSEADGKPTKLRNILANSVMGVLQLRQELAQSQRQAAAQARRISELSMQVQQLKSQREDVRGELAAAQQQHPRGSYTRELLGTLQADNDRLQRRVAKWKDLATIRQSELKALRHEHVALAHQATETRQLAYQICTGHGRLNSNSSARLQLDAPAVKQTALQRPSLAGGTAAVPPMPSAAGQRDLNAGLRAAVIVDPSHPPPYAKQLKAWGPQPADHNKAKLSSMLGRGGATRTARPSSSQSYTRRTQRMSALLSRSARDIKI